MNEWQGAFLDVIESSPEGITVCDAVAPDYPVIYANPAFEQLTGYSLAELRGANLRLLQGTDREQEARTRLREAIAAGNSCRVLLRNYRKDGSQFWNELLLQPLRSKERAVTHFVGYYRDAGERMKGTERQAVGLPTWMREDRITGLSSRPYFEELLARDWGIARRDQQPLTLMLFDLDALESYNETFGRAGGDACIRRVARTLGGCFRRSADLVARWDGGCLAVLVRDTNTSPTLDFALGIGQRVTELHIHHPRSSVSKFVTVSGGIATIVPSYEEAEPQRLVRAAQAALRRAKQLGRDRIVAAEKGELL